MVLLAAVTRPAAGRLLLEATVRPALLPAVMEVLPGRRQAAMVDLQAHLLAGMVRPARLLPAATAHPLRKVSVLPAASRAPAAQ
jgi:hypothetical protein